VGLNSEEAVDRCLALLNGGEEEAGAKLAAESLRHDPGHARLWQCLGLCERAAERLSAAVAAFERAFALAPSDVRIAQGHAQCLLEAGLPSMEAFERTQRLAPDDLAVLQGFIAAVAAEQGPSAALDRLEPELGKRDDWLAGHWLWSRLAAAAGREAPVDATIVAALHRRPGDLPMWQQWVATLVHSRQWERARTVAADARRRFPAVASFGWSEAAAASESGDCTAADPLFRSLGQLPDIQAATFFARHLVRQGRPQEVTALHAAIPAPLSDALLPYLSIAWRQLQDPRWHWLEPPELVGVQDLSADLPELDRLASVLRGLHNQVRQPLEQSVRYGTQTDGHLLLRVEPEIQQLRSALIAAVKRHRAALPRMDRGHPHLRHRRDRPLRFAGSWSVRLTAGGHHEPHVHPQGWLSSALYISLPETSRDRHQAGWLSLGEPQEGLKTGLPAVMTVQPQPGRLVLFPSTSWHGTMPFSSGERLTVAFDVRPPA
jgi:tetratricopeptide (TPR) repeat protein